MDKSKYNIVKAITHHCDKCNSKEDRLDAYAVCVVCGSLCHTCRSENYDEWIKIIGVDGRGKYDNELAEIKLRHDLGYSRSVPNSDYFNSLCYSCLVKLANKKIDGFPKDIIEWFGYFMKFINLGKDFGVTVGKSIKSLGYLIGKLRSTTSGIRRNHERLTQYSEVSVYCIIEDEIINKADNKSKCALCIAKGCDIKEQLEEME